MRENKQNTTCTWFHLLSTCLKPPKTCFVCHIDEDTCEKNAYIIQFTGKGKYNNKIMCLDCLVNKLRT